LLEPDAAAKRLVLLKEAVPGVARVGLLFGPVGQWFHDQVAQEAQAAARTLRLTVQIVQVRAAADLDSVFGALADGRADAIMLTADAFTIANRERLAILAVKHRWPTVCDLRSFVEAGCLMSYGADVNALSRRAAFYVDRILKSAKPNDLPIEQPTKFDLAMNSRTAKALGLTIPASLLLRADQVIE